MAVFSRTKMPRFKISDYLAHFHADCNRECTCFLDSFMPTAFGLGHYTAVYSGCCTHVQQKYCFALKMFKN